MIALTIIRLDGSEEVHTAKAGDTFPGHWCFRWVAPNRAALIEVEWLDWFGGSGFRIEAL